MRSIGEDLGTDGKPLEKTADYDGPPKRADEPAPRPEPIPKNDTPDRDPVAQGHEPEQQNALDWAMVRWTRVVGVFTFVLTIVGGIQAWAFIQSERAAIYVELVRIFPLPVAEKIPLSVDISLINTGRAQAFMSEIRVKFWAGEELPKTPDYSTEFTTSGYVPAGHTRYMTIGPTTEPFFNWAQANDINQGAWKLYVYGFVKFIDDFSLFGAKTTGFCGVYQPSQMGHTPGTPMSQCDNENYEYSR
jgi:hypothetical protein